MNYTTDKRAQLLQSWLNKHFEVAENSFVTVSGDASFRRYFRFTANNAFGLNQASLIAVDSPPQLEDNQPFITIAKQLLENDLPAPEIYEINLDDGFYVQQDFGDQLLHGSLNNTSVDHLYGLAMQYLIKLHNVNPDALPLYDSKLLQTEMHLFSDWYLEKHKNITIDTELKNTLSETYQLLEKNALEQPQVFVHRDYHSRNLMVLDYDKLGMIDFQDAVKGPITYDLVSLLKDCYIDWPEQKIQQWVSEFNSMLPSQFDTQQFTRWFDLMGIQRHLKAIGIFCRLNYRDSKPAYLNDIPRTLNYVINTSAKYQELKSFHSFVSTLP